MNTPTQSICPGHMVKIGTTFYRVVEVFWQNGEGVGNEGQP